MSKPTRDDIENLIELFERSAWQEMHLKTAALEVFLSRDPKATGPAVAAAAAPPAPPATTAADQSTASTPAPHMAAAVTAHDIAIPAGMVAVRAPNLGTFYRAPKPGAPPYVEIGQKVTADTEVCLIEVMKLFTPVKAGIDGTVRELCASDGQMVEYEQVLVIVEPDA
ncbi:MAG: acetyl-CoA carboxylase biotin carboxyl carrier protein [Gammaproteobacteria bacterium]